MIPLGGLVSGAVVTAIGLHESLYLMSVLGVAAASAVLAVPAVRQLPAAPLPRREVSVGCFG
jgi:hypothetical protein